MDGFLTALPSLGPYGIFVAILVYMGRQLFQADQRHASELARVNSAHRDELARINASHDEELAELRRDIKGCREDIALLRAALDAESAARRAAEEAAHKLRMAGGV